MKNIDLKNFDFQKYSKQIMILAIALVILLDFFLIMRPQMRWSSQLSPKIIELKRQIDQTDSDIALIAQIQEQYQKSKTEMADIEKKVPLEEDIPLILQVISNAANDAMIKIFEMRPMKEAKEIILETKTGKYYRIPISIEARGGYHLFGNFLSILENSEIFMSVHSLEITSNSKSPKDHNIDFIIDTFIFKK